MKKYFERTAILLALVTVGFGNVYAQEAGDTAIGANLVFTPNWVDYWEMRRVGEVSQVSKSYTSNGGFGAKIQYNVTTPIRVEGSFNFLPSGFKLSMWDLSVNAHYLIPVMKGELKDIIGFDNTIFSDYYKTNRLMISIGAIYKF